MWPQFNHILTSMLSSSNKYTYEGLRDDIMQPAGIKYM